VNGGDVPLKKFPRFPDSEDEDNFIYPFLSKRKTEYYDTTISQEQSFKVEEGLRNLAAKIKKIENPSHPRNREFNSLCDDILGFRIGTLAIGESHMGMEAGIYVGHTSMIPLKAMGDGVATIVGFIVTLLTEDKKLYLVEELENDIHPKALKKLLTLIEKKSTNNQFLISTHSHIVLKYLGIIPEAKIFYTEWTTVNDVPTSTVKEIENRPEDTV
ncbi:MAG: AAA family ATPase, partial [Cyclobacteriaceae bacterium]